MMTLFNPSSSSSRQNPVVRALYMIQALFNFSFFGLKSLFVLYVIDSLQIPQAQALSLFASLMTLSYATSVLGGIIADRLLGPRFTVLIGGSLCLFGLVLLLWPSLETVSVAAALFSLGAGCFKPNFSLILSAVLTQASHLSRSRAFTQLYMAMNVGTFLGPLVCSVIKTSLGLPACFALLSTSFLLALTLVWCLPIQRPCWSVASIKKGVSALVLLGISGSGLVVLLQNPAHLQTVMGVALVASLLCFGTIWARSSPSDRTNVIQMMVYTFLFALFCMLFEQTGGSLLLFFEQHVDRCVFGWSVPASSILSINPLLILVLGTPLSTVLRRVLPTQQVTGGFLSFGIGFVLVSLSFFLLAAACSLASTSLSCAWMFAAIALQTMGELCLVPVGFAKIADLSPQRSAGVLMSLWLMAIAYGHYGAGLLARTSLSTHDLATWSMERYQSFFTDLGLLAFGIALFVFLGLRLKRRRMLTTKDDSENSSF